MKKMVELVGVIEKITYSSGDYYILSVQSQATGKVLTCKGNFFPAFGLVSGLSVRVVGKMVNHPKFGEQVDVNLWSPGPRNTVSNYLRYFVGGVDADDIQRASSVEAYVEGQMNLEKYQDVLSSPGLERVEVFEETLGSTHEIIGVLGSASITSAQIRTLFQTFGFDLREIIKANPYRLLEAPGISFALVDKLARSMGFEEGHPFRAEGVVLWALRDAVLQGHLCLRRGDLATVVGNLLSEENASPFPQPLPQALTEATSRLVERGAVFLDPEVGVYLPKYWRLERESARMLAGFLGPSPITIDLEEYLTRYQESHGIELSQAQKDAILKLRESRVVLVTGQPGTGKTSVTRAFCALFQEAGLSVTLMAPTGIAAKRLSAATERPAGTVHRTLGYQGDSWGYGLDCKYSTDVVILDETSMIDQEIFHQVLSSLEDKTILIIVGDDAQLPSVGAGNVLRELIGSGVVPVVRLTQIFRQAAESRIITNAHAINQGKEIDKGDTESDFRFVSVPVEKLLDLIVRMAEKLKSRDANFQVIAPKYEGVVGVNALNEALRNALNPENPLRRELKSGSLVYREGDRVIVTKNDYKVGVYNGDTGKIASIERDSVIVKIHSGGYGVDRLIEFKKFDFGEKVRLAYAITTHRSQGSEYGTVILPMVPEQGRMLQRNLIYTAVTRAKQKVWVLGSIESVRKAIANDHVQFRGTGLAKALRSKVAQ